MRVPNRVMYRNWKGNTNERTIVPLKVFYGSTEFHPEAQWLLEAQCLDKKELRLFALKDMEPLKR